MGFAKGERIVHPRHGACVIKDRIEIELVEGFEEYYVIEFPEQSLTMHIPVERSDDVGLRSTMSESKVDQVIETLRAVPRRLASNYKTRQASVREWLESGRPVALARAIRDLSWRAEERSLTQRDRRMLSEARELLIAELALVLGETLDEARQRIDKALAIALANETARAAT